MANKLADKLLGWLLVVLIVGALAGGLISSLRDGGGGFSSQGLLAKGALAPPIRAVRQSDHKSITQADLDGKVVVLDFWATWCGPCREEAPVVRDIAKSYAGRADVMVMAMDSEPEMKDPFATIDTFLTNNHLQGYPVVFPDAQVADGFQVQALPTLYVLGKDGTVRFRAVGEVPGTKLRAEIEAALRG